MIKTCITELKETIVNSNVAITTFKNREVLLECEDYIYSIEELNVRLEIIKELEKAKKLLRTRKGWRWEIIKSTKGNPIKILFIVLAWWRNFKFKTLWQRK